MTQLLRGLSAFTRGAAATAPQGMLLREAMLKRKEEQQRITEALAAAKKKELMDNLWKLAQEGVYDPEMGKGVDTTFASALPQVAAKHRRKYIGMGKQGQPIYDEDGKLTAPPVEGLQPESEDSAKWQSSGDGRYFRTGPDGKIEFTSDPQAAQQDTGVEQIKAYLDSIPDEGARWTTLQALPQKTRERLIVAYGSAAPSAPKKGDPVMLRRAVDAEPALQILGRTDGFLDDPRYSSKIGPVAGHVSQANSYDPDAQEMTAHIFATQQVVGKFLEGGVLKEQDVVRYLKMLPKMTDMPEVARRKNRNMVVIVKGLQDAYRQAGGVDPIDTPPFMPDEVDLPALGAWLLDNPEHPMAESYMQIYDLRMSERGDAVE